MRFSASSLILFICFSSFKVVNHRKDTHNIYCGDIFFSTLKIVINNRYCRFNYFLEVITYSYDKLARINIVFAFKLVICICRNDMTTFF